MNNINNLILDEERALYHITDSNIVNCRFDGPKDGESAIKRMSQYSYCRMLF